MAKKKVSDQNNIEAPEFNDKKGIALEDQLIRVFDDVLEDKEQIIKGYKPVKSKMFLSNLTIGFIFNLFLILLAVLNFVDSSMTLTERLVGSLIPLGIVILIFTFSILFTCLSYKNTYYVLTNKRIIIRSGVFGVDFQALDIANIGASMVTVSLLDKILRKKTGSIKFGLNSSPINAEGKVSSYAFMHITDPYKVHKEIKEFINKSKEEKA